MPTSALPPNRAERREAQRLTPEQRVLRARMAAHALHSQVDSTAHLQPARDGFRDRFRREVDPEFTLSETERERRTDQAIRSHMQGLALKASRARSGRGSP